MSKCPPLRETDLMNKLKPSSMTTELDKSKPKQVKQTFITSKIGIKNLELEIRSKITFGYIWVLGIDIDL